jgi:hypothetical protein
MYGSSGSKLRGIISESKHSSPTHHGFLQENTTKFSGIECYRKRSQLDTTKNDKSDKTMNATPGAGGRTGQRRGVSLP